MICNTCLEDKENFFKNHGICKSCYSKKYKSKKKDIIDKNFNEFLLNIPKEITVKEIPNTNGLYFATSDGKIIRKKLNPIFIKFAKDENGYFYFCMSLNNKVKKVKVHRMIGISFLENPLGLPVINHKNLNKNDNSVSNLEWCTIQENTIHYYKERYNNGNIKSV